MNKAKNIVQQTAKPELGYGQHFTQSDSLSWMVSGYLAWVTPFDLRNHITPRCHRSLGRLPLMEASRL
jgi:hypothetical protein